MALTGSMALSAFQAAIESSYGTVTTATRKQPLISGRLTENIERQFPSEARNNLIGSFRTFPTKHWCEVSTEWAPTFEDLPWVLNFVASNQTTGTPTAVGAFRYDFSPRGGGKVDDLKSACIEAYNTTQTYTVPGCVATRFELGFSVGAPATMTVDWLGQRALPTAVTSNLSDRVTEDINGATAIAYIDTTTIGSSAVTNVLDAKFSIETNQTQFWALSGNLHPIDAYRNAARSASLEMTVAFTNTTEYALFQAASSSNTGTPRKVRLVVNGSSIAGTVPATTKSVTVDWYGVWQEAPLDEQDGLLVLKLKGQSMYDTSAATDWAISVVNSTSPLP